MIVKSAYQLHGVALAVDQLGWDALTNVTLFKNRETIAEFHPLIESEFENPCVDKESVSLGFPGIVHNGTGQEDVVASNTEGKAHTSFLFQGVTENTILQTSRNAMTTSSSSLTLRERRDAIVQEHIAAEKAHDIPRTIATFHRPRYELAPFCCVSDGDQAVHDLLAGLFAAFPDFDIEHPRLHHADEAVVVECVVTGTRRSPFAGVPPTGRRIEVPLVANFDFDGDLLMCEKVHFDLAALIQQLQA